MYSFVYRLYFWFKRIEKRRAEAKKQPSRLLRFLIGYAEWFYNIPVRRWYEKHPSKKYGLNRKMREQKVIVSFTSYPKRIKDVWLVAETLLRQSYKPDEVILWLADSQFDGLQSLPPRLLALQERGLSIRFCDDLRSHKKYYHVLQEFPNDLVILADDDMFYPRDTIQKLIKLHEQYPGDICCMTSQVIDPSFKSMPSLWRNPRLNEMDFQHTDRIQTFTGSGTLIPPSALPMEVFDRSTFERICLYADDLWITFMAHRKGTKLTTLKKWRPFPVTIYGTAEGSLYYINAEDGQNDVQWQNLLDYYGVEA